MSISRDVMSRFLTGIAENLEEECRESMLHESIDLSSLIVYVLEVEESRTRKHTRSGNM